MNAEITDAMCERGARATYRYAMIECAELHEKMAAESRPGEKQIPFWQQVAKECRENADNWDREPLKNRKQQLINARVMLEGALKDE